MDIIAKPAFKKAYKSLHASHRAILDKVLNEIAENPKLGQEKKGDLVGVRVYKFKINNQEKLLAYKVRSTHITIEGFGSHENFYRDLKR